MNRVETISRILTAQPGGALAEQIDAFSPEDSRRPRKLLRTFGAQAIVLTNDLDRGQYGVGNGLALKRQEFMLGRFEPLHKFKLHGEGEYAPTRTALADGALLSMYLDLSVQSEHDAIARPPMFAADSVPELTYFIFSGNLVNEDEQEEALERLTESITARESFVMRPRIMPEDKRGWPQSREPIGDVPAPVTTVRDAVRTDRKSDAA